LQLQHQQAQHQSRNKRHAGIHRVLAARRILHRAADLQQVARRQRGADLVQRRRDLRHHRGRLFLAVDVGAHRDRGQAVAMPDDAFLEAVLERGDLRQRDAPAVRGRHRQAAEQRQAGALFLRAAQQDLDQPRCPRDRC
jgi:hypothetical protein